MPHLKPYQVIAVVTLLCCLAIGSVVYVCCSHSPGFYTLLDRLQLSYDRCDGDDGHVTFYSVGNADCCGIYSKNAVGLVDVGKEENGYFITQQLRKLKTDTLDFVVITHPHDDHAGGYEYLSQQFVIKKLLIAQCDPEDWKDYSLYQTIIECAKRQNTEIVYIEDQMTATIDTIRLQFFHPLRFYANENDCSVFVYATVGKNTCLITGDAGKDAEILLLAKGYGQSADILKVGHHGSKTATTDDFLDVVDPTFALISVGWNSFGHPAPEVTNRLAEHDITLYRTDTTYTSVTFRCDDGEITPEIQ